MNEQEAWELYQSNKHLIPRERVYSVVLSERERVLREVGEWLDKEWEDESVSLDELVEKIQALKSGKMPGEAKR